MSLLHVSKEQFGLVGTYANLLEYQKLDWKVTHVSALTMELS